MKFDSYESADAKKGFKIIRRDSCADVPGQIISADEVTGECSLLVTTSQGGETKTYSFGADGIRIIRRGR